jgi:protein-tyrosine kinase
VTSSCPGEGKTFTALNLALCLSEDVNQPVLLVDGDPWTHGATRALGIAAEAGLCEALTGNVEPERLIVPTELANLAILGPGAASPGMTKSLASRRALHIFRKLLAAEPGRLVVIDGPSLLLATEAAALALFAGQVVLVVAAGQSSEQSIEDSLNRMGERGNLWFVLNHGPLR